MAATLFRLSRAACQCQRAFSTAAPRAVSLQWDKNDPEALAEVLPEYPYGPARWYKQSNRGLYGGTRIQFGNNVSEEHEVKTRRTWRPNIFTRRLYSKSLNRYVQVRVSARVLRTIDKLGGLDEYLLGEKQARIKELGVSGWWLRWAIMQTPGIQARFHAQRRELGLTGKSAVLEAVENGLAEPDEQGEAAMEDVPMDNAFKIEHNPDLPPIKFRVSPGKHIMLTATGWKRTRASLERRTAPSKEKIEKSRFSGYVEQRMESVKKRLRLHQLEASRSANDEDDREKKVSPVLPEKSQRKLLRQVKTEITRDLRRKSTAIFEEKQEARQERKKEKHEEKVKAMRMATTTPSALE
jgi:large subunit ribosomal protein L28